MHILIIRPGAIGDTLLTLPVIQALREQYAPSSITLVGNASVLPLAHACGVVDEVYDYQEARWSYLFLTESRRIMRDVQLEKIVKRTQLAICWLRDPDGIVERNLRAAGIQQVILAPGRPDPSISEDTHIIAYLAKTIGLQWGKPLHEISLSLPIIAQPEDRTGPIALHPGSGGAHKCWPVKHFAQMIYYLLQEHRAKVLVLTGPAEQERLVQLRSLLEDYPQSEQCTYLVDAPLLTVAQRLQQCQCYIGNDSGLTHLAGMLGLPTLALFGPGAKALDMSGIVPLESPISGGLGSEVKVSSFLRSVRGYCNSDPVIWHPPGPSVTVLHTQALEHLDVETVLAELAVLISSPP